MILPRGQLLRRALDLVKSGRPSVACLVVRARGSTPQSAGALMLVDDAAGTWGTIGGGCVEAEVRRRAHAMMSDEASGVMTFKLDHDYGWDDGLICGGTLHVAVAPLPDADVLENVLRQVEARRPAALPFAVDTDDGPVVYTLDLPPRPRLYIAGAGHVGRAVARLAPSLEYEVTIFDDRADLIDQLDPPALGVAGDIAESLGRAPVDEYTSCLVVTRGHRNDEAALEAVVGRGAAYVGMIGSRRKVKLIFDDLRARGVPADVLREVHAPVGLDIGAVTVDEIAIAIAAELVEVRRRRPETPVRLPDGSASAGLDAGQP